MLLDRIYFVFFGLKLNGLEVSRNYTIFSASMLLHVLSSDRLEYHTNNFESDCIGDFLKKKKNISMGQHLIENGRCGDRTSDHRLDSRGTLRDLCILQDPKLYLSGRIIDFYCSNLFDTYHNENIIRLSMELYEWITDERDSSQCISNHLEGAEMFQKNFICTNF